MVAALGVVVVLSPRAANMKPEDVRVKPETVTYVPLLTGVMDERVQLSLLAAWMALFALFASRKFSQPIKDDIGDKSVFIFNALPEDEQQALLLRLQEQQPLQQD